MTGADWTRHLHQGESLLWQGRPDPPARPVTTPPLEPGARIALSLLLAGLAVAVVWMAMGAGVGGLLLIPVGMLVAAFGFGIWFFNGGQAQWYRFWLLRRGYALTDRRVIEVTRFLGRDWRLSTPLARLGEPRVLSRGGCADLVYRQVDMARPPSSVRQRHVFAFRFLHDAERVRRLIARAKADQSAASIR